MIQAKYLEEIHDPICNSSSITLQQLSERLRDCASEKEIPLAFEWASVKFGSLLNSQIAECLRIYHPEHTKDYFSIIVHHDKKQFMIYRYGASKQISKQQERQQVKKSGGTFVKGFLTGHEPEDGVAGNIVGAGIMMKGTAGMLLHAIKAVGGSKSKLQEEEGWYAAVCTMVAEVNT